MVECSIVSVPLLNNIQKESLFSLFINYFENTHFDTFISDLSRKELIIIIRKRDSDQIVGFSTIQIQKRLIDSKPIIELYSGDTIVDQRYWRFNALTGPFGHIMLYCIKKYPDIPVYWLLITKGFRTYRFLPIYFKQFYPDYQQQTSDQYKQIINTLAEQRFGECYIPDKGIVTFNGKRDYLTSDYADIPSERLNNPHIRFFVEKNPGYRRGDELVCLARVSHDNLRKSAFRVIESSKVEWQLS